MTNQVSYLRAQLAHRDAQLEQVRAERDNQFVQEEEALAHMRLLSSEAKDWKSRVVTEAEEVLCRESAQFAQQATEAQEAMDQHYKAKWQQAEADLTALCQSNSAQVQSFASKMHETNEEHQKLYTAQERQIQLEAQALREAHQDEQQAAQTAQEYQNMVQELRRQADEQPDLQKLLWRRQLSQQADYRAEIHELHTELLNMKEKSEMKSHLAANMCRIDHTVPSRTVESEPANVLNTLSPGRSQRWILPHELETPHRPTSSGLQSPVGAPVQLGPSPQTREYTPPPPCHIPPAQWGEVHGRAGDDECELFGGVLIGDDQGMPFDPFRAVQGPDEIANASPPSPLRTPQPLVAARCVNGNLVRPDSAEEESPSTACRQSIVTAPGGVPLGRAPPGQQQLPGGLRGRGVPPPPPPPPPAPVPHAEAAPNATAYPLQWTPLHTRPKAPGGGGPPNDPGGSSSQSANGQQGQGGSAPSGGGAAGSPGSGGGAPPPPGGQQGGTNPPGNTPPQQTGGAGFPGGYSTDTSRDNTT